MKNIVKKVLAVLAIAALRRYRPMIVGITGSAGKTSTKEATFSVLKTKYRVRRNEKSLNTEIGLPLAVLGAENQHRSVFGWLRVLTRGLRQLIGGVEYPEMLILEFGVQEPGDMDYLLRLAPPLVGVMTAVGEIPVHVEFFSGPLAVAEEKAKLIRALPPEGYAVLNCDDDAVAEMKNRTRARVLSYGFGEDAAVRITNYELRVKEENGRETSDGISLKLEHGGSVVPVRLSNTFGKQQAYAAAAAASVGLVFNMNLAEISEALSRYESPPGRLKLLRGNKGTAILDDTYNASPASTAAALEVLGQFPARRRIAVLGDMLELGKYAESAHRSVGDRTAGIADLFLAVGERMKFSLDEATAGGVENRRQLSSSQVFWFAHSGEAGKKLEELLRPGDVILVKGSQGMRMERVIREIMAEPERAKELLVRQDDFWLKKP